jgi:ABC-type glycerol-3-phosphate transport system substrate-binding protein
VGFNDHLPRWAQEGRLVDLADTLGPFTAQFDQDTLEFATMLDATTGRRSLYVLPMGRNGNYLHVWRSLLEQAGLRLEDIPKEWEPFWVFWCDKVQPALRKAAGRDDVYGIGLPMSGDASDTGTGFFQFVSAYEADYVTRDGRLVIDEPLVRDRLAKVLDSYTALYRKGCVPPDAGTWDNRGNNKAFLEQRVALTMNNSLSIPNALKASRPDDYYKNTATIAWPAAPTASRSVSGLGISMVPSSRMASTFRSRKSSCVSWSARVGSPTGSTSRAIASCHRCRRCWSSHFG